MSYRGHGKMFTHILAVLCSTPPPPPFPPELQSELFNKSEPRVIGTPFTVLFYLNISFIHSHVNFGFRIRHILIDMFVFKRLIFTSLYTYVDIHLLSLPCPYNLSVLYEHYSRNTSCALNCISTFLL